MADLAAREAVPDIDSPDAVVTSLKRTATATPYRFRDLLALDDFDRHARRLLPPMIYQYVAGGVETGAALRGGREAYADYRLVPRMLRDVSGRDQGTTLFGKRYDARSGFRRWGAPPSSLIAATWCWPRPPGGKTCR
jgi:L-lactate dehydrogenase (cytochrome)